MPYLNATIVSAYLADVSPAVAEGAHAVLVLDGAGSTSPKIWPFPATSRQCGFPLTPPKLKPIENVWKY